jgi:lactam utilization protein B
VIYEKTDVLQAELVKAAENNGVYVLSLSSFLDLMGYSRKQLVSSPGLMSEQE